MPMPSRSSVEDFYAALPAEQQEHLRGIESVCAAALPKAEEVLHWNQPAFVQDGKRVLMIQAFAKHASLRFPPRWFATVADEVKAAGYPVGAGFIKLHFDKPLPTELLTRLVSGRLEDFEATDGQW